MRKKAVVAIGGNSLIKDKNHQAVEHQMEAVEETTRHIVGMVQTGFDVVITHGNGPQVGFSLLRSEMARNVAPTMPLAVCGAETQGFIGYMIQQKMLNQLKAQSIGKKVATVVTQVEVNPEDDAFQNPTKPIGPFYTREEAEEKRWLGWEMVEDAGRGFRRVVASPMPNRIVESDVIKMMIEKGVIVIAVGGGGIPVVSGDNGTLRGVPAVIDKDYASALLAREIGANLFVVSTGVEKVYLHFNKPEQVGIGEMTLGEVKNFLLEGHFQAGSMKPKIEAVISFLEAGGEEALITSPENLLAALQGKTGTRIKR